MAHNKVLLVEGKDDLNVIAHILKANGHEKKIHIKDQEGLTKIQDGLSDKLFEQLIEDLKTELKQSELKMLGIVVDADENCQSRWQSLANRLKNLGYKDVPKKPKSSGTILIENEDNFPPIGVWLMPNNFDNGMLEDFVKFLVPDESANLWQLAENAVDSIPENEIRFSKEPDHTIKAQVHTYLSWQKRPGVPFGVAIREKFLTVKAESADEFLAWLGELFEL